MNNVLFDPSSILSQQTHNYSVEDKLFVVEQFDAREGSNAAEEQFTGFLEVTNEHAVDSFENLEFVFLVPISAFINKLFACGDILLERVQVILLQVHEDDLEQDLHLTRSAS